MYARIYRGSGKLEGKNAIITGGDSGIGRSVAIFFAREGADVTIHYLKEEQSEYDSSLIFPYETDICAYISSANETARLVREAGRQANLVTADFDDPSSAQSVVDSHVKKFGRVDILVNNASHQVMVPDIADLPLDQVESIFRRNIVSMIAMAKFAVPHMRRGGAIINTTSVTVCSSL